MFREDHIYLYNEESHFEGFIQDLKNNSFKPLLTQALPQSLARLEVREKKNEGTLRTEYPLNTHVSRIFAKIFLVQQDR